jgi:hypothetical protein
MPQQTRLHRRLTVLGVGIGLATAGLVTAMTPTTAYPAPTLTVSEVEQGLTIPWDITWVGNTMRADLVEGRQRDAAAGHAGAAADLRHR